MTEITVQLFGAFRDLSEKPELNLELPSGSRVSDVRAALAEKLGPAAASLLASSALADERSILRPEEPVAPRARLAVLPPVCGG